MVLPNSNFNPNQAIPNNPFYVPETYTVQGAYNNLVVGTNLFVNQTGCLSATPGGPIGTVFSVAAGGGLCTSNFASAPITGGGTIALTDYGPYAPGACTFAYPSAITVDIKGRVQNVLSGVAPVTSVGAGTGLCTSLPGNAAITTTGFISLCALNPNPTGTFANATVTLNAYGQVTGAVAGTAPVTTVNGTLPIVVVSGANTNVSVNAATPSTCGVVHGCTAALSTALGVGAGSGANFASSGNNVALGVNANVASWTGTQLAIGSNNGNWLTGCNDLSIKPGAGIRDCTNSFGTTRSLLRTGLITNTVQWTEIGYTVSQVAGPLSNVSFGPSAGWSIEWSDTGNIAEPGPGLFLFTNNRYVAWSTYTNGGFTAHYTTNILVPAAAKLLSSGGALNVGATQYVDLTINDSLGVPQQGYQITYQHSINGVIGPGMKSLFVITRVY